MQRKRFAFPGLRAARMPRVAQESHVLAEVARVCQELQAAPLEERKVLALTALLALIRSCKASN